MKLLPCLSLLTACLMIALNGCSKQEPEKMEDFPIKKKIDRFAATRLTADTSGLSAGDREALRYLIQAAQLLDTIYIRQVWEGNEGLLHKLEQDNSTQGNLILGYFKINMSPWSSLDDDEPFVEGVPDPRPPGANYYPLDMTKEEFTTWLAGLQDTEKKQATGFFYVIRRDQYGKLQTVAYSEEYKDVLERAAALLRQAAAVTTNATLKDFLVKRAEAFLSNEYYDSDVAWMNLDSPIDVTIGPYEVYMDKLFNYKAAFEAYVTLRDEAETKKLATFSQYLQEIENNLPIDKKYRNPKLGAASPIRVVDEVMTGGEAKAGVQTAAFNLPNDERITREKGSKRVMLKNVQEAKFNKVLIPISRIALDPSQQQLVSFDPFFTHILAHELMHGLGPHTITMNGKQTTVRQEMKELSSALEEAKADVSGLFALQYLIDKGVVEKSMEQQMYVTYLAGVFRSVRFGITEAHGRGMAMQFNYMRDDGAFVFDEHTGTFTVDFPVIKKAVQELTGEIMTIQARGSYTDAKVLLEAYGVIRPEMQQVLDKLEDIPIDILPDFAVAR